MISEILPWILFLAAISQSRYTVAGALSDHITCSPFRLLVIWHTSNGEDSAFIEQKRLIIRMIHIIPQRTEIQVTAINTQLYHILHFRKNSSMAWIYKISMHNSERLDNHTIQRSLVNNLILNFREQKDNNDVADEIVLVVSEKTEIEKNSFEMIKNVKRLVIFTGWNLPPPLWTSLATDRHHLVTLNTTSECVESNINGAAETVLDLLCQDSRLICDSDEFLAGEKCIGCSYICSEDTKNHPVICRELCPYYEHLSLTNASTKADKYVTYEKTKQEAVWSSISIFLFVLLALGAFLSVTMYVCKGRSTHLRVCCKRTKQLNQETIQDVRVALKVTSIEIMDVNSRT